MLRLELFELIANGENSGTEFKRDELTPEGLAKELVAFANLHGGRVLLGVEDDGTISGVLRTEPEEWVLTVARDKVRPPLIPYVERVRDVEPGRDVLVVSVDAGYAVHARQHHNSLNYYIRVGRQSREASPEELARLQQQRGTVRAEQQPVPGAGLDLLDRRRLLDYFARVRGQEVPRDEQGWVALLLATELAVVVGTGAPRASVAGALLFSRDVGRLLPQSSVDAAAYAGLEKDYAAHERTTLRAPLVALLGDDGLVERGLIEQAADFVARNTGVSASLIDGLRREEKPTYPAEVVREVLVNAVVHRDYLLTGTDVELSVYADRLEVISPGRLPNGVTTESMRVGVRAARNQLLKDTMRDYGYLEHMGLGVPRKIIRGMREHNGSDPDFEERGERLMVRLWA